MPEVTQPRWQEKPLSPKHVFAPPHLSHHSVKKNQVALLKRMDSLSRTASLIWVSVIQAGSVPKNTTEEREVQRPQAIPVLEVHTQAEHILPFLTRAPSPHHMPISGPIYFAFICYLNKLCFLIPKSTQYQKEHITVWEGYSHRRKRHKKIIKSRFLKS